MTSKNAPKFLLFRLKTIWIGAIESFIKSKCVSLHSEETDWKRWSQVSYLSFFDVLGNYPHVSNVIQGLKYKRSQAIQWGRINNHNVIGLWYTIVHTKVKSMIHFFIVLCNWGLPERHNFAHVFCKKCIYFLLLHILYRSSYRNSIFMCGVFFLLWRFFFH